jgi:hypothetical protein
MLVVATVAAMVRGVLINNQGVTMTLSDTARVVAGPDDAPSVGDANPVSDIVAAHEAGWDVELYLQARELSIGLEMLEWAVNDQGFDPDWYLRARRAGATNKELAECRSMELGTYPYLVARECGVSHDEFCEADRVLVKTNHDGRRLTGRDLKSYTYCLRAGATHREAIEAHCAGLNLSDYAKARHYEKLDHAAAMVSARSALYPPADS